MLNDPTISVTCDVCGTTIDEFPLTPLAGGGWDARNVPSVLKRYGWIADGKQHICDACAAESDEEGGKR